MFCVALNREWYHVYLSSIMKANPNICWNSWYTAIHKIVDKHIFFPAIMKKVIRKCMFYKMSSKILYCKTNRVISALSVRNHTCGWRWVWPICVRLRIQRSTDLPLPRCGSRGRSGNSNPQIQSRRADMSQAGLSLTVAGAVLEEMNNKSFSSV